MLHCLHAFLFFPVVRKLHFTHTSISFVLLFPFPPFTLKTDLSDFVGLNFCECGLTR